jgi:alpha-beta hydrolase superfamily lysophospholipase
LLLAPITNNKYSRLARVLGATLAMRLLMRRIAAMAAARATPCSADPLAFPRKVPLCTHKCSLALVRTLRPARLACPVHICIGAADALFRVPDMQRFLACATAAPTRALHVVPQAGHHLPSNPGCAEVCARLLRQST